MKTMKRLSVGQAERGQIVVLMGLLTVVLLSVGALVLDLGMNYLEITRMQAIADTAALAGANELPDETAAAQAASQVLEENGFVVGQKGCTGIDLIPNPDGKHPGRYKVRLGKSKPTGFARVLGYTDVPLEVQATALYIIKGPISVTGGGSYGVDGIQNPSLFGPYAEFKYGDCHSPLYLSDGSRNPHYQPQGYDFDLYVPADYAVINGTTMLQVEIFDPECWNRGNKKNAGPGRIDEIRKKPKKVPKPPGYKKETTTRYQLFAPDETLIATATYGPKDGIPENQTDMQWVTPPGFEFDTTFYGTGHYRINVKSLEGSSENGFNLRAGPPTEEFEPDNGTSISATGQLPTNFNVSGVIEIEFCYVPSEASGGKVFITKFDTDVGSKSVTYRDDLGNTWPGVLSGNGTFAQDVLDIPEDYPGSVLYATYEAGAQDTSVWEMYYESKLDGKPGRIFLVD